MSNFMLGEEGTEQFTIETRLDGKMISVKPIHDPFISTTVGFKLDFKSRFKQLFFPEAIKVEVHIRGSEGAQRAIMTLDPHQLARDTEEILEQRRYSREHGETGGFTTGMAN